MSSSSVTRVKRLKLGSRCFTAWEASTFSIICLTTKFEGVPVTSMKDSCKQARFYVGQEAIAPNLGLAPKCDMEHWQTHSIGTIIIIIIGAKIAFCGLQNTPKYASGRIFVPDPADELTTLPNPLVGWIIYNFSIPPPRRLDSPAFDARYSAPRFGSTAALNMFL